MPTQEPVLLKAVALSARQDEIEALVRPKALSRYLATPSSDDFTKLLIELVRGERNEVVEGRGSTGTIWRKAQLTSAPIFFDEVSLYRRTIAVEFDALFVRSSKVEEFFIFLYVFIGAAKEPSEKRGVLWELKFHEVLTG